MEIPQNYINELTYKITGDCIEVDQIVGHDYSKNVYRKEIDFKVKYGFLLEDLIIPEMKSVSKFHSVHRALALNHMYLLKFQKQCW